MFHVNVQSMHCSDTLIVILNSMHFSQYEMGHMKISNAARMRICKENINQNKTKIRAERIQLTWKLFSMQFICAYLCVIKHAYSPRTKRSMAYLPLLSVDWLVKSCHATIDEYMSIFFILFCGLMWTISLVTAGAVSSILIFFWELKKNITGIEGSLAACPCRHIKSILNKLIVCQAALKLNSYSPSLTFCPLSSSLEICSISEGDSTPRKSMMHQ